MTEQQLKDRIENDNLYSKTNEKSTSTAKSTETESTYKMFPSPFLVFGDFLGRIEMVPARVGRWEIVDIIEWSGKGLETISFPNEGLRCSCCHNIFEKKSLWAKNFCPNCGAVMKEGKDLQ